MIMRYCAVREYCRLLCTPAYRINAGTVWSTVFLRYRCSLSTVTIATWWMPHIPATQCLTVAIHSEQCLHTTEQHTHTHHPGSLSPTQASSDSVSRLTHSELCFSPRIRIVEVMTTQIFFWLTWPTYQSQIAQCTCLRVVRQYYV